uniref:[histone H3]-trimethyl-L-lysine(9) demethylase n=1 Tax=Gouania willdenowi TaxID=441366 RepID=A0A8C5EQ74_GOUWI
MSCEMASDTSCPNPGGRGIMTFYPTYEEFSDFSRYIAYIESQGAHKAGLAKIVPPKEWKPRGSYDNIDDLVIPAPIQQVVTGKAGLFTQYNIQKKAMTVGEFRKMANSDKFSSPNYSDFEELERKYWTNVTYNPPIYGADVNGSLYEPNVKEFNICNLGTILDTVEQESGITIEGVNTPYLYFGMWKTTFPWHTEDMDLYSINYLHFGEPKSWYAVSPEHGKRMERLAKGFFPGSSQNCEAFLRHKMTLISPYILRKYSIPFEKITQNAGEFMVTFPYAYHAGFNHGFNCAESTNFATERWIEYGKQAVLCSCRKDMVKISMDVFVRKYQPERYAQWLAGRDVVSIDHSQPTPEAKEFIGDIPSSSSNGYFLDSCGERKNAKQRIETKRHRVCLEVPDDVVRKEEGMFEVPHKRPRLSLIPPRMTMQDGRRNRGPPKLVVTPTKLTLMDPFHRVFSDRGRPPHYTKTRAPTILSQAKSRNGYVPVTLTNTRTDATVQPARKMGVASLLFHRTLSPKDPLQVQSYIAEKQHAPARTQLQVHSYAREHQPRPMLIKPCTSSQIDAQATPRTPACEGTSSQNPHPAILHPGHKLIVPQETKKTAPPVQVQEEHKPIIVIPVERQIPVTTLKVLPPTSTEAVNNQFQVQNQTRITVENMEKVSNKRKQVAEEQSYCKSALKKQQQQPQQQQQHHHHHQQQLQHQHQQQHHQQQHQPQQHQPQQHQPQQQQVELRKLPRSHPLIKEEPVDDDSYVNVEVDSVEKEEWAKPLTQLWQSQPFNFNVECEYNKSMGLQEPYCCICQLFFTHHQSNVGGGGSTIAVVKHDGGQLWSKPLIPEMCFNTQFNKCSDSSSGQEQLCSPHMAEDGTSRLISCSQCCVRVHTSCYGVSEEEAELSDWLCARCKANALMEDCCLCSLRGGALKRANNNKWVHVLCAVTVLEARFVNVSERSPIDLSAIPLSRFRLKCVYCRKRMRREINGCCVQCSNGRCSTAFHPSCAQAAGVLMHPDDWPFTVFITCYRHRAPVIPERDKDSMRELAVGQKVICKNKNGRYYHSEVEELTTATHYEVVFDDGSYSDNLLPEDIESYDCVRLGPPPKGESVQVRWTDGLIYGAKFVASHSIRMYLVEFEDGSQCSVKREDIYSLDEDLPKRVKSRLSEASDMRFKLFMQQEVKQSGKRQRVINSRYRGDFIEPMIY